MTDTRAISNKPTITPSISDAVGWVCNARIGPSRKAMLTARVHPHPGHAIPMALAGHCIPVSEYSPAVAKPPPRMLDVTKSTDLSSSDEKLPQTCLTATPDHLTRDPPET